MPIGAKLVRKLAILSVSVSKQADRKMIAAFSNP